MKFESHTEKARRQNFHLETYTKYGIYEKLKFNSYTEKWICRNLVSELYEVEPSTKFGVLNQKSTALLRITYSE